MDCPSCDCCYLLWWDDPVDGLMTGLVKLKKHEYDSTHLLVNIGTAEGVRATVHKDEISEPETWQLDWFAKHYEEVRTTPGSESSDPPQELQALTLDDAMRLFIASTTDGDQ